MKKVNINDVDKIMSEVYGMTPSSENYIDNDIMYELESKPDFNKYLLNMCLLIKSVFKLYKKIETSHRHRLTSEERSIVILINSSPDILDSDKYIDTIREYLETSDLSQIKKISRMLYTQNLYNKAASLSIEKYVKGVVSRYLPLLVDLYDVIKYFSDINKYMTKGQHNVEHWRKLYDLADNIIDIHEGKTLNIRVNLYNYLEENSARYVKTPYIIKYGLYQINPYFKDPTDAIPKIIFTNNGVAIYESKQIKTIRRR